MRFPPTRSRRTRSLFVVVAVVALAGACVKQDPPGVAIRSLKSEIVFGLNPPAAPPPGVQPFFDTSFFDPPDLPLPVAPPRPDTSPQPEGFTCPDALATATPENVATTGARRPPKTGQYRWKARGQIVVAGQRVPLPQQFVTREIVNVSDVDVLELPIGGGRGTEPLEILTYSYSMRSQLSLFGGGVQVATFQVKDNPLVVEQDVLNFGKPIVAGEPERGVVLKQLTYRAPNGAVLAELNPTPGILLLPLPVNIGEEFQSVSVDPLNGAVVLHSGVVEKRFAVDACGELVDGWQVRSVQAFISPLGVANIAQYDYVVATQFGGILLYERTRPPDVNALPLPTLPGVPGLPQLPSFVPELGDLPPLPVPLPATESDVEFSIAQAEPSPFGAF